MIRKVSAGEASALLWFKSSYSDGPNGNSCVETAMATRTVHVRDSKSRGGPRLAVTSGAWARFITYVSEPVWFKSSYSGGNDGNSCVELAVTPGVVHVRDSKSVGGPRLALTRGAWAGFVAYASEPAWSKSSYSSGNDGNSCVEVAAGSGAVRVRDSKSRGGPRLAVTAGAWARFVAYASEG